MGFYTFSAKFKSEVEYKILTRELRDFVDSHCDIRSKSASATGSEGGGGIFSSTRRVRDMRNIQNGMNDDFNSLWNLALRLYNLDKVRPRK